MQQKDAPLIGRRRFSQEDALLAASRRRAPCAKLSRNEKHRKSGPCALPPTLCSMRFLRNPSARHLKDEEAALRCIKMRRKGPPRNQAALFFVKKEKPGGVQGPIQAFDLRAFARGWPIQPHCV